MAIRSFDDAISMLQRAQTQPTPRAKKRAAAGEPTALNLYTLRQTLQDAAQWPEHGLEPGTYFSQVPPTSIEGIRRCMKAGLIEQSGYKNGRFPVWVLTAKGRAALGAGNQNW